MYNACPPFPSTTLLRRERLKFMQMPETATKRVKEERTVADIAAYASLSGEQLAKWESCKSTHRFMAFKSKQLVAYRLYGGLPDILDVLTNTGLSIDLERGLESSWQGRDGSTLLIGHKPVEIAPSCFLWHPKHNTLEYVDWKGGKSLRFSLMWRTAFNPAKKVTNEVYLSESIAFARNFG